MPAPLDANPVSEPTLRILHLEDDFKDAELIAEKLKGKWPGCLIEWVEDGATFEARLAEKKFDLILSDYNVPGFNGMDALAMSQRLCPETPFILVSGNTGEEVAVESLKLGATDFVIKNSLSRLIPSVQRTLKEAREHMERVILENQLREREKLFSQITDNVKDLIAVLDLEGRRVYNSPSFQSVLGSPKSLRGTDSFREIHPEDRERVRGIFQETVRTGIGRRTEYRFLLKDGSVRFMESQGAVIQNDEGKITNVLVVSRDVTERRRAEEELQERARQLSHAQKLAKLGSWEWDLTKNIVTWSNELYGIYGLNPEEFRPGYESYLERIHPEDRSFIRQKVEQALRDHQPMNYERRIIRGDGEARVLHVQAEVLLDAESKPYRMRGTCQDITERKRAEEQVREQAALLDKTQDAIYVRDLEQRINYWNKGAELIYGWTAEEAIGKRADELFSKDDSLRKEEVHRLTLEKGEWMGELNQISKAGKELIVESRRTLLRDDAGKPKCILEINTNITARKQVERQMQRAQRLESIGTLASGVAHDLNNAIAPIMMGLEILRMQSPKSSEMINTMESSARRGAEMVRQLLTFAKGAEGARLIIQPRHLLQEMEKIIRGTFPKNIQIQTSYDKLKTILGDATQLHQVLLNLCVNARDAMPHGGTLTLEAKNVDIDAAYASSAPGAKPGRYVQWRVSDTGTGIPPEILDRIFEPFFTTKGPDKGTGLGLSTVVGIIKGHGGFLRVYSTPGQGTTFDVYLPAEASTSHETTFTKKTGTTFLGNGETVLVVDDETSVRQVARSVLTALNFKVLTAADGTEALLLVAENRADLRAVITDLHMPHMDGLTFVRVLKRMLPDAGIIVASGRMEERESKEFKTLEVSALLDKPFTQDRLIEVLKCVFKYQDGKDNP